MGWIVLLVVIGLIVWGFIALMRNDEKNAKQPIIVRNAIVVDKRVQWSEGSSLKFYYLTCEFEDLVREEVSVPEKRYGLFVVGDEVKVTKQGDWVQVERILKRRSE
ncbi:DUF2500 domain-containing protein [Paenibacillus peoriae]|uniref:DUF2500 domain-containing protein n=1 Tax=Paenibacillus peoriae TaxID=59893 RepID=UPI00215A26F2|nr:DUF2500 domain-containing protein [Paenibacillus peoriae]